MAATLRGVSYPFFANKGSLKLSEDFDLYPEYIFSVLETEPGERILRRNYGTQDLLFLSVAFQGFISLLVGRSLSSQIANVEIEVSDQVCPDNRINVEIRYSVSTIPQPPLRFTLLAS